ncbi:MAG: hypothetical protein Q7J47_03345 [Azoarcus sp.]|nr:hypothetical protein [Azoarcus sp.]
MSIKAYRGFGKIKIAAFEEGVPFHSLGFRDPGNASAFALSAAEQSEDLPDYTSAAGGVDASYRRVESVSGNADLRHYTPQNLAQVFWGAANDYTGAVVAAEATVFRPGMFVPTKNLIDLSVPVVISKSATPINTADYVASPAGVTFALTAATAGLIAGDAITIGYTSADSTNIEALIETAPRVAMLFEGVNAVDAKPLVVAIWKARLGIASSTALIGDGFGTLPIGYTVEKDSRIVTPGLSQYFKVLVGA